MNSDFNTIWETYTSSWKLETAEQKRELFEQCLHTDCEYTDPLIKTRGWSELLNYMLDFHKMLPGGYFETYYFLAHNNQSIAKWQMKDASNTVMGEGVSHGSYTSDGKLLTMTGFFETTGLPAEL
ncbi:hypothetical protein [Agarilytica rhodophyticola]|uniref:hypothetical protein n=1 Tax=Agarilytica rhodophyticola TaxID=1737490 RepID=UPI000B3496E4|nr:hypothetical protein [Agarilytica rhodophyticola]